ncbi:ankyrin repeat and zinc finger domain-containing protein 1 isoform X2 [Denticeps clupeoides]|uniref:ankyrin repeat and zinc finger domain-containing protein 1 isoform X2 n=1 Tax=Denticeps clupeoides TaxID=299321 RepID=UPI0010A43CA5|nr:ankyrin repeat and zinc finger domain-containing protein 1 isoform X2 [Denticeps clupeoides]
MSVPESRSLFDVPEDLLLVEGLQEVGDPDLQLLPHNEAVVHPPSDDGRKELGPAEVSDRMLCSACQSPFDSREEQIEHYKLDWHRFNLRQRLAGRPPVSAEDFETKTGAGDVSSISGSDSEESDSDTADRDLTSGRLSSKLVLQNAQGRYLSVHRCVLQSKKSGERGDPAAALLGTSSKSVWVVLMTGGGHFAGAVFQGKEVLQHKTFHRYTVRAKRGTAQGLRDGQNRSHAPKSAGASLRRYNEAALTKDIQDLLDSWSDHLRGASAIFLRAPSHNKAIFLGGRTPPLDKADPRVRTVPFATRRATFREVRRVHDVLSTVQVYGRDTPVSSIVTPQKTAWKKSRSKSASRATGKEQVESSSEEDDDSSTQLLVVEETVGTLDLREHEIHPPRRRRKRRKEKRLQDGEEREGLNEKGVADQQQTEVETPPPHPRRQRSRGPSSRPLQGEGGGVDEQWEFGLRDALYTACKTGDLAALHALLLLPAEHGADAATSLNRPVDDAGFTLLHVAAAAGQRGAIRVLLDAGSDPACKDRKGQTPYNVAPEKDTRNAFRKYMAEHPDKYDYGKAQVPAPLTSDIEAKKAEKKKAQKAARRQKEREQKEVKRKEEAEEEERRRFAALSDREKRALAAERRLAEQKAAAGCDISNIRRCWQCGESLLNKVPFRYLDFSFCAPRCVQAHRKAHDPAAGP